MGKTFSFLYLVVGSSLSLFTRPTASFLLNKWKTPGPLCTSISTVGSSSTTYKKFVIDENLNDRVTHLPTRPFCVSYTTYETGTLQVFYYRRVPVGVYWLFLYILGLFSLSLVSVYESLPYLLTSFLRSVPSTSILSFFETRARVVASVFYWTW